MIQMMAIRMTMAMLIEMLAIIMLMPVLLMVETLDDDDCNRTVM